MCRAAGIEDVQRVARLEDCPESGPYLVLSDDVFLTEHALRAFLDAIPKGKRVAARFAVTDSLFLRDSAPLQQGIDPPEAADVAAVFPVMFVPNARPASMDVETVIVDLEVEERPFEDLPRVFTNDEPILIPFTSRPIMRLSHWIHLVRANQYALLSLVISFRERPKWRNALSLAGLVLKSFPPTRSRVARALVQKGKGCKIHPSAVVEASILGNNVEVGPHAIVQACVVDDDAVFQPHSHATMSVIGKGAVLSKQTWTNLVVLFPGAVQAAHAQMSVFGRDSFVATYSPLQDLSLEGEVKVEAGGKVVSCGSRFMGVCIGHEAKVGGGVFVAHGRAVPNGAVVVKNPQDILRKVEPGEGVLSIHEGIAMPLDRIRELTRGKSP